MEWAASCRRTMFPFHPGYPGTCDKRIKMQTIHAVKTDLRFMAVNYLRSETWATGTCRPLAGSNWEIVTEWRPAEEKSTESRPLKFGP